MKPIKRETRRTVRVFKDMDKPLFFACLLLIIFGSLNIVTASSREAVVNIQANLFYFFNKHMIILLLSTACFIIVTRMEIRDYKRLLPFVYGAVVIMNVILIFNGSSTRGANNWIDFGFIKLQPSELAKPTLILTMAFLFQKYRKKLQDPLEKHNEIIWLILITSLIFPAIVFLQKDLGTAIILFGIFFVMFIFGPIIKKEKVRYLLAAFIILVFALLFKLYYTGYILSDAQLSRLTNFYNPCSKYEDTGYQICNAFIAINNGGLFGVGIGNSSQKYSYIPEPHTDMVFAIIAEENGILVCGLIFILYLFILYRILKISLKVRKRSSKYICLGTATYIFLHILINLGGLFGLIPLTGVPLPFLSYGGSFTLSLITTLGIVQRVHIEMKNELIEVR